MSDIEKAIELLHKVPDYKLPYIIGFLKCDDGISTRIK